jgi:hypothetical protein
MLHFCKMLILSESISHSEAQLGFREDALEIMRMPVSNWVLPHKSTLQKNGLITTFTSGGIFSSICRDLPHLEGHLLQLINKGPTEPLDWLALEVSDNLLKYSDINISLGISGTRSPYGLLWAAVQYQKETKDDVRMPQPVF